MPDEPTPTPTPEPTPEPTPTPTPTPSDDDLDSLLNDLEEEDKKKKEEEERKKKEENGEVQKQLDLYNSYRKNAVSLGGTPLSFQEW